MITHTHQTHQPPSFDFGRRVSRTAVEPARCAPFQALARRAQDLASIASAEVSDGAWWSPTDPSHRRAPRKHQDLLAATEHELAAIGAVRRREHSARPRSPSRSAPSSTYRSPAHTLTITDDDFSFRRGSIRSSVSMASCRHSLTVQSSRRRRQRGHPRPRSVRTSHPQHRDRQPASRPIYHSARPRVSPCLLVHARLCQVAHTTRLAPMLRRPMPTAPRPTLRPVRRQAQRSLSAASPAATAPTPTASRPAASTSRRPPNTRRHARNSVSATITSSSCTHTKPPSSRGYDLLGVNVIKCTQ